MFNLEPTGFRSRRPMEAACLMRSPLRPLRSPVTPRLVSSGTPVSTATLVLNVMDAAGNPSAGTRVRLTSVQANVVGTLTVGTNRNPPTATFKSRARHPPRDRDLRQPARRRELQRLAGASDLGTLLGHDGDSVALPQGGGTQTVGLLAQGRINGQLWRVRNPRSTGPPWTSSPTTASTDTPEAPLSVFAQKDGTFSLAVSPGRPYVVLVAPDASSGLARTFIAPGRSRPANSLSRRMCNPR